MGGVARASGDEVVRQERGELDVAVEPRADPARVAAVEVCGVQLGLRERLRVLAGVDQALAVGRDVGVVGAAAGQRARRSGGDIDAHDVARAVVVGRRGRRAHGEHAATVGREHRAAGERPRAPRDAVRPLAVGVHGPEMRGCRRRARRPGVVGDLEPVVVRRDALLVRRLVAGQVRERRAVAPPGEALDAFLRVGDAGRLAAVHAQHVELRRGLVLCVGILRRGRDVREPVAARRPGRRAGVVALAHQRARRAAARVDQHQLVAVLVLLEVRPADDQCDALAVRRDLRVEQRHQRAQVALFQRTVLRRDGRAMLCCGGRTLLRRCAHAALRYGERPVRRGEERVLPRRWRLGARTHRRHQRNDDGGRDGDSGDAALHHFIHCSNHPLHWRSTVSRPTGSLGKWPPRGNATNFTVRPRSRSAW